MEAIKLTLDSGDASAIQLIGSLYEKLAYGSLRIGDINRAFIAGKMVVKLNDNNIVGWLCVAHCASILKTSNDFIYYSHNLVRIISSNLKKIFVDIKSAIDSMDFEKVMWLACFFQLLKSKYRKNSLLILSMYLYCLFFLNISYIIKFNTWCREVLTYTPNCPQIANAIAETEFFITSLYEETLFDDNITNWKMKMAELQPVMDAIEV